MSQFDKYTNPFHNQFFNFENKKVILYVDEPIDMNNFYYSNDIKKLESMGVTVINDLKKLLEALS